MITLRQAVDRYLEIAGGFGAPAPLSSFGFTRSEVERVFSDFDEDYHISRFFHFTEEASGEKFAINGVPTTHITIDAEIGSIL